MQLLYGNDGVNYRMIDKSSEMSEGIQKSLLATYSKYEFVSNWKEYSSVDREPEAMTYVTSNLDNQIASEQLVVCKTGHMRQYSSPSYYFHGVVKKVSDEFYKKDFFQIFNYEFVRDIEIGQFSAGSIEEYSFTTNTLDTIALTDEQLVVILASFMSNEKKGRKTKIFVDAVGDRYNSRSREILAAIYHYLPYELRKRYGFKSYSQDVRNIPARVSFVLFNRNETIDNGEFITLQETIADIEQTVEKKYVDYAIYLVKGMDAAAREQHFEALSKLSKNGRLTINECITYYSNINQWSLGTQEELLPDWIQYIDQNSFRKGPLYEMLLEIIVQKVDNQYYNDYLFDDILKLYNENIYNLSPLAAKTIRFADCLEEIYIEPDRFKAWYRSQLQSKLNKLNTKDPSYPLRLKKLYEDEIAALKTVNIMSEELSILLQEEICYLTMECNNLNDNIDDQKEHELETIGRQLSKLDNVPIEVFVKEVLSIQNSIQFEENKRDFTITVEEWIDKNFPKRFINLKEVDLYYKMFPKLKNSLSPQKFNKCIQFMYSETTRLTEEKEARVCVIEKTSLLKCYGDLLKNQEKGILNLDEKIQVVFGKNGNAKAISVERLKGILEFALCPNDINEKAIGSYVKLLLLTDVLTVEHLEYLISSSELEENEIRRLIDYFFKSPTKVSGIYVAKLLFENHPEMVKTFIKKYEDQEGEAFILSEELKSLANAYSKNSQKSKKGEEERHIQSKPEKKISFGGLFGGKR